MKHLDVMEEDEADLQFAYKKTGKTFEGKASGEGSIQLLELLEKTYELA